MVRLLGILASFIIFATILDIIIFHIFRQELIPLVIIIGGVLILFSKGQTMGPKIGYDTKIRPGFRFIRRWVFGIVLIFMGIYSYNLLSFDIFGELLQYLSVYTLSGQIIVVLIAVINLFDIRA